jgi:HK97 family phage major capsid protein
MIARTLRSPITTGAICIALVNGEQIMDINTLKSRLTLLDKKANLLLATAERETRGLTDTEKTELTAIEQEMASLATKIERSESDAAFTAKLGELTGGAATRRTHGAAGDSWGAQFMAGIGDFFTKGLHHGAGGWSTPNVELSATTLTESGSPIAEPQYLPGIVPSATAPVVMSTLFAQGVAISNALVFMKETLFDNKAAATAEAAPKPESGLTFVPVTEPLIKVPTFLPVSNEMLDDVPAMGAYINARLRLMVLLALDGELLNGSGTAPHMKGLLIRTDLAPAVPAGTSGIDAIAQQIGAIENAQGLPVDSIVLNGADWLKLGLLKTTTGEYLSGSPFTQGGPQTLFGRAVATTPMMPQGVCLVGSFRSGGGQLFTKGGVSVQASNSHADYFIRNLVAIRAEIRAALALYRPAAFGLVTGLNPVTP